MDLLRHAAFAIKLIFVLPYVFAEICYPLARRIHPPCVLLVLWDCVFVVFYWHWLRCYHSCWSELQCYKLYFPYLFIAASTVLLIIFLNVLPVAVIICYFAFCILLILSQKAFGTVFLSTLIVLLIPYNCVFYSASPDCSVLNLRCFVLKSYLCDSIRREI